MPEAMVMVKDPMIGRALDSEKLFLQTQTERYNYLLSYKAMQDAETGTVLAVQHPTDGIAKELLAKVWDPMLQEKK